MSEKIRQDPMATVNMEEVATPKPSDELAVVYVVDPEEEKQVLKKLDRVILPLMALVYFFQYLDKQSINYAAVFGLSKDLDLSGTEFSWVISLFYFGQLCSEYPGAYLMSRLPITILVGVTMTWVSMFGVSQIVGGLMMYGIGGAKLSMQTWRVMFLVCGGLTVGCGVLFIAFMPRDTTTAWFLNERERRVATERLALDRATRDHTTFDWSQAKEALTEPRTLFYALMALFITIPTPITKFSSLVINGFGYSPFQTMLVGLPSGAVAFILTWIGAISPLYFPNSRCYIGILLASMPMLGSLLLLTLPAHMSWGIVVSTWFAGSSAPPLSIAIGLMSSNVKGNTKKAVVGAIFFVFYCVGCISGPQLWQRQDAPRYYKGCIASVTSWGLLIISFLAYSYSAKYSNRKRDREALEGRQGSVVADNNIGVSVDSDLTERQDRAFRYIY
ncbi:hypothetical protein H2199_007849 [Coniosporium tulheliwenetii]|uniref:Uncharacterized protein n=1 Tax=Coniosporium tulheliwenetii TaxID=3383036 RepID=A0ACC2YP87_9PEZI|nr:hypothetical protein H2199_007849 [Cladosporium sp. JES 115]